MELRIYFRQTQFSAIIPIPSQNINTGDNIIYIGNNPATIVPAQGTVSYPNYIDYTSSVANINTLAITWTTNRDEMGSETAGILNNKKSVTGQLTVTGDGYKFIKKILIDSVSAAINSIDVRVEQVGCGVYDDFVINAQMITWSEDDICSFSITMKQKDAPIQCIQQTLIADNWQGWFMTNPANGKKHPRFMYCNESRPNVLIVVIWWLLQFLSLFLIALAPVIIAVSLIIQLIKKIYDTVAWIFGGSKPNFTDWTFPDFLGTISAWYMNSSGCGKMHPAPLIRDYIDNVCLKCGVGVDGISDPIFHNKLLTINANSGYKENINNPYYNATYMYAPSKKGVHLFYGLFGQNMNTSTYYIEGNEPIEALDQFLDKLKVLFNAAWTIKYVLGKPVLYFMRKDGFDINNQIYDFSMNSADRAKILRGISYSWNDNTRPSAFNGIYSQDPGDICGNEELNYTNDIVSFGDGTDNPIYGDMVTETAQIGASRFRLDGADTDYLMDAVAALRAYGLLPSSYLIMPNVVIPFLSKYCDYALLLQNDQFSYGKVIIWDETSGYENSKVIKTKNTYSKNGYGSEPDINYNYNKDGAEWHIEHPPITKVHNSPIQVQQNSDGMYRGGWNYDRPALLCNYPMFLQSFYKDNLYDYFHWIDDIRFFPTLNLQWEVKIGLCCEDLNRLKVFNDGSDIALYSKVKLPMPYYQHGKITEITVSYDSGNTGDDGKYIEIKGIV